MNVGFPQNENEIIATGIYHVAGVCGYLEKSLIEKSGTVSGRIITKMFGAGGVVAFALDCNEISEIYSKYNVSIESIRFSGGLIGYYSLSATNQSFIVEDSYSTSSVYAENFSGGFFGKNYFIIFNF